MGCIDFLRAIQRSYRGSMSIWAVGFRREVSGLVVFRGPWFGAFGGCCITVSEL